MIYVATTTTITTTTTTTTTTVLLGIKFIQHAHTHIHTTHGLPCAGSTAVWMYVHRGTGTSTESGTLISLFMKPFVRSTSVTSMRLQPACQPAQGSTCRRFDSRCPSTSSTFIYSHPLHSLHPPNGVPILTLTERRACHLTWNLIKSSSLRFEEKTSIGCLV